MKAPLQMERGWGEATDKTVSVTSPIQFRKFVYTRYPHPLCAAERVDKRSDVGVSPASLHRYQQLFSCRNS